MLEKFAVALSLQLLMSAVSLAEPATVGEAVTKLDLVTLALPEGAEMSGYRREAELSYRIKSPAKKAFDFVDKQLTSRDWKQMPGAQIMQGFASANYTRDGYMVYLSVSPRGAGESGVTVTHKGNVSLEDVPVPDNMKKMHAFPAVVMYKSPDGVDATRQACEAKMLAAGWSPYGSAGDTNYYRQNAVQVDLNVMSAPGQGGATVVSVTSKLLSLELPAPPFADDFRYSGGTTALDFDTDKSPQEVADFYRQELAPRGWKATTDKPVEIKWKKYTVFRNPSQEMITIATHDFEGRTRVHLDHQNAAEVADEDLRGLIAVGKKATYRDVAWLSVSVETPTGLSSEQQEDWAFKLRPERDKVFAVGEALGQPLEDKGWIQTAASDKGPRIRRWRYEKEDRVIHVLALRPARREPWVAMVGVGGVKLEPR